MENYLPVCDALVTELYGFVENYFALYSGSNTPLGLLVIRGKDSVCRTRCGKVF